MNVLKRISIGWMLCAISVAAAAAVKQDAYTPLDEFMRGLQGLQAEFRQVVSDAQGRKVEESSGALALSRPNRFRWDYREPHAQVIVADGANLWMYDPDLEQATVRPLDRSLAGTPAMLLSGEGNLRESFKVQSMEKRDGIDWIVLTPRRPDAEFKRVRLGLRGATLAAMELADKLGQVTSLQFSDVQRNPVFTADRFIFMPPPGIDVIGESSLSK